jgi:hypothetical protein
MKSIDPRPRIRRDLSQLGSLLPFLTVLLGLILAACKNSGGGSGY